MSAVAAVRSLHLFINACWRSAFHVRGVFHVTRGRFRSVLHGRFRRRFQWGVSVAVHRRNCFGGIGAFSFKDDTHYHRRLSNRVRRVLVTTFSFVRCRVGLDCGLTISAGLIGVGSVELLLWTWGMWGRSPTGGVSGWGRGCDKWSGCLSFL